ncbi:50S ribosomal protein L13 [Candidatus Nomurabacteria bacterium]|nr:50S ribosomal protein L13 [Candidatus Nomurabacteria bacterium]
MTTIDAQDKTLGRVASAAAKALLNKHSVDFAKNVVRTDGVEVINASKVRISGDKARDKEYVRYSGYPGGQKIQSYQMLVDRKGHKEAIRKAILGMLPKNKLQALRIKLLTIKD